MIDLKALIILMTLKDYQELSLYELSVKVGLSIIWVHIWKRRI